MSQGLYIIYEELDDKGVNKKIRSQFESFNKNGCKIDFYLMKCKEIWGYKLFARLPFTNLLPKWEMIPEIEKYDYIYMRRPGFMSGPFLQFLKLLRKRNKSLTIIMEIPTYPYDKEYIVDKKDIPFLIKDIWARRKIHKYIDYIALLTDESDIFGVKTVKIINGYDFDNLPSRSNYNVTDDINIAVVARFKFWHGYERIIEGLHNYYFAGGRRRITLHFVGDGNVVSEYKKLAEKYNLDNIIEIYGFLDNNQIMKVYNKCNLAIDCLGGYKKNLQYSCSLKTREYLAVGLPIISGMKLDLQKYDELLPYILEFDNCPEPIDIHRLVEFYDSLYKGNSEEDNRMLIEKIRSSAKKHLDSIHSMDNVISVVR